MALVASLRLISTLMPWVALVASEVASVASESLVGSSHDKKASLLRRKTRNPPLSSSEWTSIIIACVKDPLEPRPSAAVAEVTVTG